MFLTRPAPTIKVIGQKQKIVVVGAGIAGLTSAHFLSRHGFEVVVLEQGDTPGGRMRQVELDGLKVNTGARILYTFYSVVMELIDELGLRNDIEYPGMSELACDDGIERYPVKFSPDPALLLNSNISLSSRLKLASLLPGLIKARFATDPDDMSTSSYLDGESLESYIVRKAGRDFLDKIVNPLFRGARSWNASEISPAFFLTTTAHMPGHKAFTFKQGIGHLAEKLAAGLNVNYGSSVNSIERTKDGGKVVVDYSENDNAQRLEADLVVCATEGAKLKDIIKDKNIQEKQFFSKIKYNSLGIVYFVLKQLDKHEVTFYTEDHPTSLAILEAVPGKNNKPHLFCELSPESVRDIDLNNKQAAMQDLVIDDVRKQFQQLDNSLDYSVTQWIEHMLPVFYPGYISLVNSFKEQQQASPQAIYYCGDYLSQALVGGACASGKNVATQIIKDWG